MLVNIVNIEPGARFTTSQTIHITNSTKQNQKACGVIVKRRGENVKLFNRTNLIILPKSEGLEYDFQSVEKL